MADQPQPGRARRHGLTITRVFPAPRERVWEELTEPECFADWFGGPDAEVPVSSVSMDVRPGGGFSCTMYAGPDRREIRWDGEYQVVEAPERLVFTISDEPGGDLYELVSIELTDLGQGQTQMRLEQHGYMEPGDYDRTESGWGTFLDRLAERVVAA